MRSNSFNNIRAAGLIALSFLLSVACSYAQDGKLLKEVESVPDSSQKSAAPPITATAGAVVDSDIMSRLSAPAQEVAKDLDIVPSVQKLLDTEKGTGKDSLAALRLREQMLEEMVEADFEIRSAISHIDDDISATNELRDIMEDRREKRVQKANILNFVNTGTTGILATTMNTFPNEQSLSVPAGIIGSVGGALNIGISTYTLRLNQGDHLSHPAKPNMLSHIFGYEGPECFFPQGVWNYLNDPYPGTSSENETRRVHLIKLWERLSRINSLSTPAGKHRIGLLTGVIAQKKELTIDLLEDRALMLADLRAAVSNMDTEMLEIMKFVRSL
ncbi:MAG TPA: hypothetical protein V6C81_17120 [Planktothrix sp.]|jgi:hypothetical protein